MAERIKIFIDGQLDEVITHDDPYEGLVLPVAPKVNVGIYSAGFYLDEQNNDPLTVVQFGGISPIFAQIVTPDEPCIIGDIEEGTYVSIENVKSSLEDPNDAA